MPPPEIKRVVSTTSEFQRTEVDILQVSNNHKQNFALYEQLTAENGLASISTVLEMTNDTADLGEADDKLLVAVPRHGCWDVLKP
jgi:hypothetical protein